MACVWIPMNTKCVQILPETVVELLASADDQGGQDQVPTWAPDTFSGAACPTTRFRASGSNEFFSFSPTENLHTVAAS